MRYYVPPGRTLVQFHGELNYPYIKPSEFTLQHHKNKEKKRIPLLVQEHKANSFSMKHRLLQNEMWVGSGTSKQSFGWLTTH